MIRYLLLLFLFLPAWVSAQSGREVVRQKLVWVRYNNQLTLHPKLALHSEVDNRAYVAPFAEHHLVLRSVLRYTLLPQVEVGAGLVFALQQPHDPRSTSDLTVPELRPQQDITVKQTVGKITLNHRYQLDERFIRRSVENELVPGYTFHLRFRYRLQAQVPLYKAPQHTLKLMLADELMFNAGKSIQQNIFDQNRVYIGLQREQKGAFSYEVGYMKWYQQRPSGTSFFNRDILRFSVFHRVSLPKHDS